MSIRFEFFRAPLGALVAMSWLALSGCANMSGLGGDTSFKCKAPDGVQCQSVSGTYANARAGNLPSQRSSSPGGTQATPSGQLADTDRAAPPSGMHPTGFGRDTAPRTFGAIRSDPTVIRIWVAPWEDADGDLMEQTYVYLPVDSGRWLIEHNRQRITREFAPVRAPATAAMPIKPVATRADDDSPSDGVASGFARLRNGNRADAAPAGAAQ